MSVVAVPSRTGAWAAEPGLGVYVHIPFCAHRCHYCDFNTYEGLDDIHGPYVDALVKDIERTAWDGASATSVFFGGGTPTLLAPTRLARVLAAVVSTIGIAPDAEVTVEANPETVDVEAFAALLEAGFNRFSIGVQSVVPHVLAGLGRTHSGERALEAIAAARAAGAEDVNADLIFGSVWETDADWDRSLQAVIAAGPDHISAYALTIEEGTPLHTLVATGRVRDVDPDVQAARHQRADEVLGAAGYERYEISNWSRGGRASRHNVLYWSAGDYFGFGAGAHGHLGGRRYWGVRLPREYASRVDAGSSTEAGAERLDPTARGSEALMLGLRLTSGIEVKAFDRRYPDILDVRAPEIADLERLGLLEWTEDHLRMTARATLLASEVGHRLL